MMTSLFNDAPLHKDCGEKENEEKKKNNPKLTG